MDPKELKKYVWRHGVFSRKSNGREEVLASGEVQMVEEGFLYNQVVFFTRRLGYYDPSPIRIPPILAEDVDEVR